MQLQFRRFTSIICPALALALSGTVARGGTCFVWRVANTPAPCYLVGTLHALSAHDYPLPSGYDQAFRDTQRLVFEIKPDMKSDFSRKFDKAMMYPTGDGVQRHVHPKTWEIIKVNFSTQNMFGHAGRLGDQYVANGIQQLRPWAIAYLFYGVLGYSDVYSSLGVDHHLWLEGKRKHKEFSGLETNDEHVQVLGGLNDIESELILLDAIARRDKQKGEYEDMRAAWKRGDTSGVWANVQRFRNLDPGADVRLLDVRNVKWVPRIRAEFNSGKPTSIVVGCAHMLGPNGLIALLERNGYKFEQL